MGQFWTKLVVIVHKIARFRTRKPNNTLSALKSIYRKNNNFVNPEKPDVPLNKNDAFQKVQKRRVQEKR